jgi:multisubunit Na+/H+ antiporter MnhG subunit
VTAPPGALGVVVWALCALAAVAVAGAAGAALVLGSVAERLHLVTVVTSVAGPATGLACALALGASTSTAAVVVVVVLLAATAPVLQTAIARADREGRQEQVRREGSEP